MKIERLISIIMILLDKNRVSAQTLAEMFEVSSRTIYRDIDTINMAGIPIRSVSGVGGGFEIMPEYKMDKKTFSTADLSAILMGLSGLSEMIQGEELLNALTKIKSFIPAENAKDIEFKANQIYIDLNKWLFNKELQPNLEAIKSALQEKKLLSFDYFDRHGSETKRLVEPYQLVLKSGHWYFQGYCLKRHDFRLFRLTRLANLKIVNEIFIPRDYQKPQLDISDIVATMQVNLKIRIHRSIMDRVLDYCSFENFLADGAEYYFVNFPFIENDYYYDMLLSFGDKCECIEPAHIRSEIKRKILSMVSIYEND